MTEMTKPGDTMWHTSEADGGGPDVGIEVMLNANQRLYAGEVPGSPGWSIALRNGSDRVLITADVDARSSREMIEAVALSLRKAASEAEKNPEPAPVKRLKWHGDTAKWGGLHYTVQAYWGKNQADRSKGPEGWFAAEHTTRDPIPGPHPSEEAAKAAAQTHFDAYIRSALTPQT